ncbi:unnamed protein product [Ambrosiozyma monospora]|uniref:Unnamed protein product n=1 Tax=Ambrosiozyma monospora TaxID=43982 RepID=A0ACB5T8Y1_AMBMO|nr:unnamed protein product [Ambrosiozyma monospora]
MTKFGLSGTVNLLGTPAEEFGGGKVKMVEAGAWDSVDVSIMVHPMNRKSYAYCTSNAHSINKVEFFGKTAHAAAAPWEGINALDALVITYNAISVLRQQFKPGDIIQCNFSDAGESANIITGYSAGTFIVRASTRSRVNKLKVCLLNCVKAGAIATGCEYKIEEMTSYDELMPNEIVCELYRTYMNSVFDVGIPPLDKKNVMNLGASTDQGNVSYAVPAIHGVFPVDSDVSPHNPKFAESTKTKESHKSALKAGMGMAFTGLEVMGDAKLLDDIKEAWKHDLEAKKEQEA